MTSWSNSICYSQTISSYTWVAPPWKISCNSILNVEVAAPLNLTRMWMQSRLSQTVASPSDQCGAIWMCHCNWGDRDNKNIAAKNTSGDDGIFARFITLSLTPIVNQSLCTGIFSDHLKRYNFFKRATKTFWTIVGPLRYCQSRRLFFNQPYFTDLDLILPVSTVSENYIPYWTFINRTGGQKFLTYALRQVATTFLSIESSRYIGPLNSAK